MNVPLRDSAIRLSADVGGTFTDVAAFDEATGALKLGKTLTTPQRLVTGIENGVGKASSEGKHWDGPFPYNDGPVAVEAAQHTHPHPRFSPDGSRVVFTSDKTGYAQIYEVML